MHPVSLSASFRDYYQKTHSKKLDERGVLIYHGDKWTITNLTTLKKPMKAEDVISETLTKIMTINPADILEADLIYWIKQFNYSMAMILLKNKQIKPIAKTSTEKVRFASVNEYRWLSNFFITLIYDPQYRMIYPSSESGYVSFKARKAAETQPEIDVLTYAHCLAPNIVKRLGASLWHRNTEEDSALAVAEMTRLVALKFNQNPLLESFLKLSVAPLEEFTSDPFWGSALGTAPEEESNQLGKIIQREREALQQREMESQLKERVVVEKIERKT